MMTKSWMYDVIIYIYALSLLFYFSDFIGKSEKAKRMGTGLLVVVWVIQTAFFLERMIRLEYMPVVTMFETLFYFSWLMVTFSLILNYFFRLDLLIFFINIISFFILALNLFSDPSIGSLHTSWDIKDELLFIHISLAIGSYVAFSIAAIFSGMYLFLHYKLKVKQWSILMKRLPSLEKIEIFIFRAVIIGMPLLILSLTLGMDWIILMGDMQMLLDPKVFNSMLILAAYAYYLIQRKVLYSSGNKLALWNLAAYALVIINYVITNFLSRFHQWIWM